MTAAIGIGYALALVIGMALGLLGGGGSILTVPVLVYVLGYSMKLAVPLSLVVVGVTSAFGAATHHRAGTVHWPAAVAFGPTALVGAYLGARLALSMSSQTQLTIFAVLMIAAAVSMYLGPTVWAGSDGAPRPARPFPVLALLGSAVGLLTGLVGVGGGFLYVPALVLLGGVTMKQAIGTSLVLIVMSCAAGLVSYLGHLEIDWPAAALFTGLAVVGVRLGSRLSRVLPAAKLRRGFAVLLVIMGGFVLLKPR